jgi:heterodisulfide reductase subunit C
MNNWKSSSPSKPKATSRVRTCYNCGNQNHFIAGCPYKRVEDYNGRLVRKEMKTKSYPPRNSDKKRDPFPQDHWLLKKNTLPVMRQVMMMR